VHCEEFSQAQKSEGSIAIGYLGRFLPFKGAHRLVQPLSKLMTEYPDVRVIFAGPKTDAHYADSIINAMSANPNFSHLGFVPAMDFLKLCDIIIVPSLPDWLETGSSATLEAMAAGKAVIASDGTPMNEYMEHGVSGLLVENDEQFYQYCKELIEAPDLRAELGQNAQKRSLQYDWNVIFDKLEQIYNSLC
jgi:glycosyltransferase involved in cell wall biosynthesis